MSSATNGADRYLTLIEATLRNALSAPPAAASTDVAADEFAVERVLPAIAAMLGIDRASWASGDRDGAAEALRTASRVVDRAGHSRPPYKAIVVRALNRDGAGRAAIDAFAIEKVAAVRSLADGSLAISAANGQSVIDATFAAWAIASPTGPDADQMSIAALRRLAREQQPDGTFLARTDADAPEPRWYDELAILHALATFASETGDAEIAAAARRAVRYHAAETQPDHASSHPWAIAAFLAEPDAIPLADMMLHAAGVQSPQTMDAVSLLLLADALDCGRRRATR